MTSHPIVVKDSTHTVQNPRQDLLEEGIDKIRGGKGMILKGFKTEKVRVEEHLRNINFYYPKEEKTEQKLTPKEATAEKLKMKQPEMRYKPRTDMERIFETINKNSFRKVDKGIIDNQLKTLDKAAKKPTEFSDEIPDYKDATKMEDEHDDFDYLGIKKETDDGKRYNTKLKQEIS